MVNSVSSAGSLAIFDNKLPPIDNISDPTSMSSKADGKLVSENRASEVRKMAVSDRFEKSPENMTPLDVMADNFYKKIDRLNYTSTIDYNKDLKIFVVKVTDKSTGDLVNQIPTENNIKMREQIRSIIATA